MLGEGSYAKTIHFYIVYGRGAQHNREMLRLLPMLTCLLTVIACFPKVRDMISRSYRTNDIHNNNRGGK